MEIVWGFELHGMERPGLRSRDAACVFVRDVLRRVFIADSSEVHF